MTKGHNDINENSTKEEIIESILGMAYERQLVLTFFTDIDNLLDKLSKEDLLELQAQVLEIYLSDKS
jgi:hypothetical protein